MSNADDSRRNWRNSEVLCRPSNGRKDYRGNYEKGRQGNQWFDSRNRFQRDDRRFNDTNLEVGVKRTILVEGTAEIEVRVITAQAAKCQNVGIVVLNVQIREFEKLWMFHVLADLEYPCILGVDFISGSKIILDFDRKSLAIPDSQIDKVVKTIEEGNVEIDLSKTGTIMSSLDLKSGYFQLAVNPSDIVKTTFVTKNGTYTFRRMPLGLSGAVPNLQKAIDLILKPVIGKFVRVYIDDVIISSPLFTHHVEHLREVFRLLQDAGLTLNKEKCKFGCDELKYLGLIISKEGIKTDETMVRAIVDMKPLRNSKEVSKFLGMSQWYAKFIKNYYDLCEPLYNLKRNLKKFCWSIEAQKAFNVVKAAITKAPVLKLLDFKKPFELFTDASSMDVDAVLNQEQRPVVFASRTLSSVERNYTVTERECLAVVWTLNKFRTYLGSLPIKVITDHAALTRLTHGKNLLSRMIRWVLKIAEFNIEWEHRLELKMRWLTFYRGTWLKV
ncbi:retrovirus-related Pol polyprotein from transposon opus [Trichonephila clavipes]|nr:retrovirus-related Pol polyprotein from transposon opus [Trichonephila clavipes]